MKDVPSLKVAQPVDPAVGPSPKTHLIVAGVGIRRDADGLVVCLNALHRRQAGRGGTVLPIFWKHSRPAIWCDCSTQPILK